MRHALRESRAERPGRELLPADKAAAPLCRIRDDARGACYYEEIGPRTRPTEIHRTFAIDNVRETWTPTAIGTGPDRWYILTGRRKDAPR